MLIEIIKTILMLVAVALLITGFVFETEIVKIEMPYRKRFRKWLAKLLRKMRKAIAVRLKRSVWFMNWLYRPSLSEQIAQECNGIRINVIMDWHKNRM